MDQDIIAPDTAELKDYQQTDVFAWANNLLQYKEDLKIELFLISKTYIPYRTNLATELRKQLEPLFIDGILEYLFEGAETGMVVRGFEEAEYEAGVLQRTQVFKVPQARETLNWLKTQEHEIETFNEEEHDFRYMKGILARVSHPEMKHSVSIVKVLPKSNVMQGRAGWMLRKGKFIPFDADAAIRIPSDNQLLIIDEDMYVFSQARLRQMFNYDAKESLIAEKKVEEIKANFRLSFPEGQSLQTLVSEKKSVVKKLQKINPGLIKQEQLMGHANEIGIDLMEDDSGAIIIMDEKDLSKFVNLLNDDYMESPLTGERYEIIKKRLLKPDDNESASASSSE
ncbi:MAG: Kiwa anti-phage protein KwaB-like domain-containing protein [Candidatus Saccharimonadales bacterium]